MAAPESSVVATGETTIRIERSGSGPPLLLLHGLPADAGHVARHRARAGRAVLRRLADCAGTVGAGARRRPATMRPTRSAPWRATWSPSCRGWASSAFRSPVMTGAD